MGTNVNTPFYLVTESRPCTRALNWALIPCVHTFFVSPLAPYPQTTALDTHNSLVYLYQTVSDGAKWSKDRINALIDTYTPNANMADHSVVARDELHESEVSQSSMICFESASPENSCFVVALFCFISLCLRVPVFLNVTRRDGNLPPFISKGK